MRERKQAQKADYSAEFTFCNGSLSAIFVCTEAAYTHAGWSGWTQLSTVPKNGTSQSTGAPRLPNRHRHPREAFWKRSFPAHWSSSHLFENYTQQKRAWTPLRSASFSRVGLARPHERSARRWQHNDHHHASKQRDLPSRPSQPGNSNTAEKCSRPSIATELSYKIQRLYKGKLPDISWCNTNSPQVKNKKLGCCDISVEAWLGTRLAQHCWFLWKVNWRTKHYGNGEENNAFCVFLPVGRTDARHR